MGRNGATLSATGRLLTVQETAARLSLSPFGVYRRIRHGELPTVRLGPWILKIYAGPTAPVLMLGD